MEPMPQQKEDEPYWEYNARVEAWKKARKTENALRMQARREKATQKAVGDKASTVEFSLRVLFPMITISRVISVALSEKAPTKSAARQVRPRPLTSLDSATALGKAVSFFAKSYARPLYKTGVVFDTIAAHMTNAAARITNEYARQCNIKQLLTPEYEACAYAAIEAVYTDYACLDGLFCDLFRFLIGEAQIDDSPATRNVVAYDILRGIAKAPQCKLLRETISGNPALAATAAVLLLRDKSMSESVAAAADNAAEQVAAGMKPSSDDSKGEKIAVEVKTDILGGENSEALQPLSMKSNASASRGAFENGIEKAVENTVVDLQTRANSNSIPTGKQSGEEVQASNAINDMAASMLSPESADSIREGDSISGSHRNAPATGRGLDEGEFRVDAGMLKESIAVFKSLVVTTTPAFKAKKSRRSNWRERYALEQEAYRRGISVEDLKRERSEQGRTVQEINKQHAITLASVLDVWRAMGRIEGFMADAVSKSRHGDGEIVGVECGNELIHQLPSELLNLAVPQMRSLWATRFIEETLLVTTRKGVGESGAGPIVAMVDISPSMKTTVSFDGVREHVSLVSLAKAFAIALARYAAQWNRKCVIVPFHSNAEVANAVHCGGYNKKLLRDQLTRLCAAKTTGGTDFDNAMRAAAQIIKEKEDDYEYADVVFFTDGEGGVNCNCGNKFQDIYESRSSGYDHYSYQRNRRLRRGWREDFAVTEYMEEQRARTLSYLGMPEGVRTYSLIIGGNYNQESMFTGDGVPLPGTAPDEIEHRNMHLFHECVACAPTAESMEVAVTRFYSTLIKEAFYREV